jgi:hypothetical protein
MTAGAKQADPARTRAARVRRVCKKKRGFVRHGVSYTAYVAPGTGATQPIQLPPGPPPITCDESLRADGWPAGRRLAVWNAYEGLGRLGRPLLISPVCDRVRAFVSRLIETAATDGHHNYDRDWACDYHACLFSQEADTDTQALAIAETTFTWFAPAKAPS